MDNTLYVEINLSCYSEQLDACIGCGIGYETTDANVDLQDTEWIFIGLSESFWENYHEFEDGIEQAKALNEENHTLSFRQALFSIFGHFDGVYYLNGEETDLAYNINFDEIMYDLLTT